MLTSSVSYFTAHHIPGAGTFQDGGLSYNNPAPIAIKEAAALFPASPSPSIVVSLGTGSADVSHPSSSGVATAWEHSFPVRLFRAFWKQTDANKAWEHLLGQCGGQSSGEYFRFDIRNDVAQPSLDDVDSMPRVAEMARDSARRSSTVERAARCVRAELFFFELSAAPIHLKNGAYRCTGNVFCRLRGGTDELHVLLQQLAESAACLQCQEQVVPDAFGPAQQARNHVSFCQPIVFLVTSRSSPFSITLHEDPASVCHISGSPFTVGRLMDQQRLGAVFGREDHL
jgi:hypothetical protein